MAHCLFPDKINKILPPESKSGDETSSTSGTSDKSSATKKTEKTTYDKFLEQFKSTIEISGTTFQNRVDALKKMVNDIFDGSDVKLATLFLGHLSQPGKPINSESIESIIKSINTILNTELSQKIGDFKKEKEDDDLRPNSWNNVVESGTDATIYISLDRFTAKDSFSVTIDGQPIDEPNLKIKDKLLQITIPGQHINAEGYKTLTITLNGEFIKHQIYVVNSLTGHTFENQLVHQLSNRTKSTKMIPLLQYLKRLSGKSKYVMMCLVKPEMKAQYCEGTRKGLNFADEVSSAGSGKMPYYEREIGQLKLGVGGKTIEETLQEEKLAATSGADSDATSSPPNDLKSLQIAGKRYQRKTLKHRHHSEDERHTKRRLKYRQRYTPPPARKLRR